MTTQHWRVLTMLHWPVDPEAVRPLLPSGVSPDTHDGVTYVGLVAFVMDDVGLLRTPGVPYLGRFPETNVRLYSVDRHGRRGVVFRSLDAARLLPVRIARASLRLPYIWSRMSVVHGGDEVVYVCRRRWRGGDRSVQGHSRIRVRVGGPIPEPTPLEHFVTARWALHAAWGGRTLYLPNTHPRWPLRRAELVELDDTLIGAAGLAQPTDPPVSVLYSDGVPVRFGWPTAV
ncbi:MAG TPA: DUF2071 domain-containing protein [Micromonosporaceae bacterium]|nr:DUF2071 domain-containing protein [Micromonosporaceae bacterium]